MVWCSQYLQFTDGQYQQKPIKNLYGLFATGEDLANILADENFSIRTFDKENFGEFLLISFLYSAYY